MQQGLSALRVLDFSFGIAGAYCTKLMAEAGADVIKVEPPKGDPWRTWSVGGARPDRDEGGALFRFLHHGTRSVVGVPGDPLVDELLASADVVVESFPAHVFDALDLPNRFPGLVWLSITPFGRTGPFAERPTTEFIVQAESGGLVGRGGPWQVPIMAGGRISEWVSGTFASVAVTAAALRAQRTGHGEHIDYSIAETMTIAGGNYAEYVHQLWGRPPITTVHRTFETPSIEPTIDGFVGFCTNSRQQFDDFLLLIDRPDLLGDDHLARAPGRQERWDEWNEIVHAWTTKHTTAEIVDAAAVFRIPSAPVADAPTLLAIDHVIDRGVFRPDPTGAFVVPRRPWTIDGRAAPAPTPAPPIGPTAPATTLPQAAAAARPPIANGSAADLPLAGIRVVDLTAWWAGPSAAGMLAALGADVIHVESVRRPDGMRMAGGMFVGRPNWWECSGFFLQANTNKRGLTLDLATPAGRELALALIATADVVIENFTPRVLASFDLGWDVIHAANPRTILVRMPAFGLTGPWRDRPGFAQTMEQVTGLAWLTGHVDDQPRIQRGPCDPNGGMHAAFATLMALAHRDRTGEGCFVEAPMFEAALAVAAELSIEWSAYGNRLERDGNRSPHAAPQNLYATDVPEQWLAVSVTDESQWRSLCTVLGRDDWRADDGLATLTGRRARHDELDAAIASWAAARPLDEALATLHAAGVPAGRATDPRRASEQPQMAARGFFEAVDHPLIGTHPTPGLPFRFSGVERWIRRPAPTVGQHNDELLDELGISAEAREDLTAQGIIGTRPVGL